MHHKQTMINLRNIQSMSDKSVTNVAILGPNFHMQLIHSQAIDENINVNEDTSFFCLRKNKNNFRNLRDSYGAKFIEAKIDANVYTFSTTLNSIDIIIKNFDIIIYDEDNIKINKYNLDYIKKKTTEKYNEKFTFVKLIILESDKSRYSDHILDVFYISKNIYNNRAASLTYNMYLPEIAKTIDNFKKNIFMHNTSTNNQVISNDEYIKKIDIYAEVIMFQVNNSIELLMSPSCHSVIADYIINSFFGLDYTFFNAKFILFNMVRYTTYFHNNAPKQTISMIKYCKYNKDRADMFLTKSIKHLFDGIVDNNRYIVMLEKIIDKFNLYTRANNILKKEDMLYIINTLKKNKWRTDFSFDKLKYDEEYIEEYMSLKK